MIDFLIEFAYHLSFDSSDSFFALTVFKYRLYLRREFLYD